MFPSSSSSSAGRPELMVGPWNAHAPRCSRARLELLQQPGPRPCPVLTAGWARRDGEQWREGEAVQNKPQIHPPLLELLSKAAGSLQARAVSGRCEGILVCAL